MSTTGNPISRSQSQSSQSSSPWIRKPLSVVRHQQEQQQQQQQQHQQHQSDHPPSNVSDSNINNNNNHTATSNNSAHNVNQLLHRHLSVWDLIGIGVGGTVGSGIFVLTGQIASQYAGRAVPLSFLISGIAACLSGICYAELSGRIPAAGSTYVYAYVCLGEWAAVIAASCLTLEYGVAGAAVARTWGDKVLLWYQQHLMKNRMNDTATTTTMTNLSSNDTNVWFDPDSVINIPAFIISAVSTAVLLLGIKESKRVMNAVTIVKMCIVLFMIIGGFILYDPKSISSQPFAPFGVSGIFRGATTSFFGYLGYDEICCVAGEAKHPARDLPRAVLGTLSTVSLCYIMAAIALTGMLPYTDISPTAGFPDAFHQRHWEWASQITAAGEVLTLPVVVLISLMAQPRLTLSMSADGLLPSIFGYVDTNGNMIGGTLISGIAMTIIATFIPFTYLDDLISAGILLAFSMTNSCLVLLRCNSPVGRPYLLEKLLILYNLLCFVSSMLWSHPWIYLPFQMLLATIFTMCTIWFFIRICRNCPLSIHFGGSILSEGEYTNERHITRENLFSVSNTTDNANGSIGEHTNTIESSDDPSSSPPSLEQKYFATPLVPYLPCLGMAVNWYLIAQLNVMGIFFLVLYLGVVSILYLLHCAPHSIGHVHNWNRGTYETIHTTTRERSNPYTDVSTRSNEKINGEYYVDGESELCNIHSEPHRDGLIRSTSLGRIS